MGVAIQWLNSSSVAMVEEPRHSEVLWSKKGTVPVSFHAFTSPEKAGPLNGVSASEATDNDAPVRTASASVCFLSTRRFSLKAPNLPRGLSLKHSSDKDLPPKIDYLYVRIPTATACNPLSSHGASLAGSLHSLYST